MQQAILGIDIGKADFHCALLAEGGERTNHFPNSPTGFARLAKWLENRGIQLVHACLEATGGWSEELATYLHERGHAVSIVNPSVIYAFARCNMSRTKTDKADAKLIAHYCSLMHPMLWKPPAQAERRLQRLVRRRVALDAMRTQERNRLQIPGAEDIQKSLLATIAFLEQQMAEIDDEIRSLIDGDPTLRTRSALLQSIPGVGERVATTLLGEIPHMSEFRSSKAVAAFAGLCPRERRSGSSVSESRLSRVGNSHVRRVLYMPALIAMRCNPILTAFAGKLRERGKRPKQIIAAVMRRLLVLAYGILKAARPFEVLPTA